MSFFFENCHRYDCCNPCRSNFCCCPRERGPIGPAGPRGPVVTILGSYNTIEELRAAHPTGNPGDAYLVNGVLYVWDERTRSWRNAGNLRGPAGPTEIQFGSVSAAHLQSGATGQRAHFTAIGLGHDYIDNTSDPVSLNQPAISIKTFTGGTITEITAAMSITTAFGAATGATVYAQLYTARPFEARAFTPVPGTLMSFTIPQGAPAGSFYTARINNLSINVQPGTQLILGFYCTSTGVAWEADAQLSGAIKLQS